MGNSKLLLSILSTWVLVSISVEAHPHNNDGNDSDEEESQSQNIYVTDSNTGAKVAQWNPSMKMNPEEMGNYTEGDMLQPASLQRSGIRRLSARWSGGIVPYVIQGNFNQQQRTLIGNAMNDYHRQTCIKFVRRTNQKDYIRILSGNSGCWSSIGRVGGAQTVNLQVPGCVTLKGTVVHELMHAVGFFHEQSREDRDSYVTIQRQNVQSGYEHNFDKAARGTTNDEGISYDYQSVMHYSAYAFSKNDKPTIVAKKPTGGQLGQRVGFSGKDAEKIRRMYKCGTRRGGR